MKREATSAKQAMMTPIAAAARTTANTLVRPTSPASTEGNPKKPLPIMQFTVSAARLQLPMARTSCVLVVIGGSVSGTAWFYHKWMILGQRLGGGGGGLGGVGVGGGGVGVGGGGVLG